MNKNKQKWGILFALLPLFAPAQTLTDGIFMPKNNFCGGIMLMQDQFTNYWEGTTKRDNLNIGTMTTQAVAVMGNYGIIDRLNVIVMAPYVSTKASAGVMLGFSGLQDLTVALKYKVLRFNDLAVNAELGGSVPMSNYLAAHPFAIGTQSKQLFGRAMVHYLNDAGITATAFSTYTLRSNIKIDATNYYTDKNVNSNEVAVPNVVQVGGRAGFYSYRFDLEATFDYSAATSGYDIRRNDMPFPAANRQVATRVGATAAYRIAALNDLQIGISAAYTVQGSNVGEALSLGASAVMAFDFNKKEATTK